MKMFRFGSVASDSITVRWRSGGNGSQRLAKKTTRRRVAMLLTLAIALPLGGCSRYAMEMFRENKLKPTPFTAPPAQPAPERWRDDSITYAWLGHATVLLNVAGSWVLTDPVLHDRIGPPETFANAFGIRRLVRLPLAIQALPPIDVVLISHAHYDHLDLPSLQSLVSRRPLLVVPRGVEPLLDRVDLPVQTLDWGQHQRLNDDLTITAFRVEHYGFVPGTRRSHPTGFNGYLLEKAGFRIAFFGDTSYRRHRDAEGRPLARSEAIDWREKIPDGKPVDLCILPIGDSHYHWNHIGPAEAEKIAARLDCRKILPIHYDTFRLTPRRFELTDPAGTLAELLARKKSSGKLHCDFDGESHPRPTIGRPCELSGRR